MISLPKGVSINHDVTLLISELNDELVSWFDNIGAKVSTNEWYDSKGRRHILPVVQYGNAKPSYRMQDGSGNYLIRFKSQDAGVGLMFLMTHDKYVLSHNMKDIEKYVY